MPYLQLPLSGRSQAEHDASWRRARMSCAADMQTLCPGKRHGMSCIAYHVLTISRTCQVDLEKAGQWAAARRPTAGVNPLESLSSPRVVGLEPWQAPPLDGELGVLRRCATGFERDCGARSARAG